MIHHWGNVSIIPNSRSSSLHHLGVSPAWFSPISQSIISPPPLLRAAGPRIAGCKALKDLDVVPEALGSPGGVGDGRE